MSDIQTSSLKSFHYMEDGSISYSTLLTKTIGNTLKPEIYDIYSAYNYSKSSAHTHLNLNKNSENFNQDDISLEKENHIENLFENFFNPENKKTIQKMGFVHKSGILLHGIAGTGKSSLCKKYILKAIEKHSAVVFNITSFEYLKDTFNFISSIRTIQNNPIIIFMDEFDLVFSDKNNEGVIKKYMDGFESINDTMFLMCTNHIENIPKAIKERKSRVRYSLEISEISKKEIVIQKLKTLCEAAGLELDYELEYKKMNIKTLDEIKNHVIDHILGNEKHEERKKIGFF